MIMALRELTLILYIFASYTITCNASDDSETIFGLKEKFLWVSEIPCIFLDLIHHELPPSELVNAFKYENRRSWTQTAFFFTNAYPGFSACIVIGVLFIVSVLMFALFFCCTCCLSTGRKKLMDAKSDPLRRTVYTCLLAFIFIIQLLALFIFAVNCLFLREGVFGNHPKLSVIQQLRQSVNGISQSLTDMAQQAKSHPLDLTSRKAEIQVAVQKTQHDIKEIFIKQSNASGITSSIDQIRSVMKSEHIPNVESALTYFKMVPENVEKIKKSIGDKLNGCPDMLEPCKKAKSTLSEWSPLEEFESIDGDAIQEQLNRIKNVIPVVDEIKKHFSNVQNMTDGFLEIDVDQFIDDHASSVRENFSTGLDDLVKAKDDSVKPLLAELDRYNSQNSVLTKWKNTSLYVIIILVAVFLLLLLLICLGMLFGICGSRPLEEEGHCNRGVGANFFVAAIILYSMIGPVIMLLCIIFFVSGGLTHTELCRYVTNRVDDGPHKLDLRIQAIFKDPYVERYIKGSRTHLNQSTKEDVHKIFAEIGLAKVILSDCKNNSFGDVILRLESLHPLQQLIRNALQQFGGSLLTDGLMKGNKLMKEYTDKLGQMDSLESFDLSPNRDEFRDPFRLTNKIAKLFDSFVDTPIDVRSEKNQLYEISNESEVHRNKVKLALNSMENVRQKPVLLREQSKTFQDRLSQSLNATVRLGRDVLAKNIGSEIRLLIAALWQDVPCRSLSESSQMGVSAFCLTLLDPVNIIWSSAGLILIAGVFGNVFMLLLMQLFRKTEEYCADQIEPDYISYRNFYIRPACEQDMQGKKSKSKYKNTSKKNGNKRSASGAARYHPVSVYPYDAYE